MCHTRVYAFYPDTYVSAEASGETLLPFVVLTDVILSCRIDKKTWNCHILTISLAYLLLAWKSNENKLFFYFLWNKLLIGALFLWRGQMLIESVTIYNVHSTKQITVHSTNKYRKRKRPYWYPRHFACYITSSNYIWYVKYAQERQEKMNTCWFCFRLRGQETISCKFRIEEAQEQTIDHLQHRGEKQINA